MNSLVRIIDQHGQPATVCMTPDAARLLDGYLAGRLAHAPEADHAAIHRLRAELKPVYTPELAYAEWGQG